MKRKSEPKPQNRDAMPEAGTFDGFSFPELFVEGFAIDDVNDVEWETVRIDRDCIVQRALIHAQHLDGGPTTDSGIVVEAERRFSRPRYARPGEPGFEHTPREVREGKTDPATEPATVQ